MSQFLNIFLAVLSEMPPESWVPDPEEVARRKDFRASHLIMSIDPKGCEDVDDALTVRKLKNGRIELGGESSFRNRFLSFSSLLLIFFDDIYGPLSF